MSYLINTEGNSALISKELVNLSILNNDDLDAFPYISHPSNGETALVIENMDDEILVHPEADTTELKNLLTAYTEEQKVELDAYIDSLRIDTSGEEPPSGWVFGRFTMRSVTEGFTDIYEYQYMVDNGWFA